VGVLGFLGAYVLVLSFALPAVLARPADVSRLSAGVFTISYGTAFVASLAAGAIWDASHQPAVAFLPVLLAGGIILLLGPGLLRARSAGMA
jgi:CP family cyanate transporter-like MFS transporter